MTLSTCWNNVYGKYLRDIREVAIGNLQTTLEFPAPKNKFIIYRLHGGYRVINDFLLETINLQLHKYKARQEIVDPIKNKIIESKDPWWKKGKII